jgi:hypothetical protein
MDDFNINCLRESKNEWISRLITFLTPEIIKGFKSIFEESLKLCKENQEKYLMTFQNLISRIPKWNSSIIEQEKQRIIENTKCNYLEDLISCVHIIQLKTLTAMRVGSEQKKIDIHIPKLENFIHNVYIQCARKLYLNVYLYEIQISPLQSQKNNREIEIIINECILSTIRENIPITTLLKVYLDETTEDVLTEEIKEEIVNKNVSIEVEEPVIEQPSISQQPAIIEEKPSITQEQPSVSSNDVLTEVEPFLPTNDSLTEVQNIDSFSLEEVNIDNLIDNEKKNESELPDLIFDEIDFV